MGWFKEQVDKAAQEIEEASTEEIDYQKGDSGYMRGSKDEPLASNKPEKEK